MTPYPKRAKSIDRQGFTITDAWSFEFYLDALDLIVITAGGYDVEVAFSKRFDDSQQRDYEESGDTMYCAANVPTGFDQGEKSAYSYFKIRNKVPIGSSAPIAIVALCKGGN